VFSEAVKSNQVHRRENQQHGGLVDEENIKKASNHWNEYRLGTALTSSFTPHLDEEIKKSKARFALHIAYLNDSIV
jgi:hypothetical protein